MNQVRPISFQYLSLGQKDSWQKVIRTLNTLYSNSTTDVLSRYLSYYLMYNISMQLAKPLHVDDINGYFVTHLSVTQRWNTCAKRLVSLPAASVPAAHHSRPPLKSYKCIFLDQHSFPNDPPLKISLFFIPIVWLLLFHWITSLHLDSLKHVACPLLDTSDSFFNRGKPNYGCPDLQHVAFEGMR